MNTVSTQSAFQQLLALLRRLEAAKIAFDLLHSREDAIMIRVDVPGERWEIEFVDYGDEIHVEIERFRSVAGVLPDGDVALEELFTKFSD
jgi:hypothetical protein